MATRERRQQSLASAAVGASTSAVACVLLQPFDVIKTRWIGPMNAVAQHTSVSGLVRHIVSTQGPAALWRGSASAALRVLGGAFIYFYTIDACFPLKAIRTENIPGTALIAGSVARIAAVVAMNPVTVLKTRLEGDGTQRYRMVTELIKIGQQEGIRGLYRGLQASLIRDCPYAALSFTLYSQLCFHLSQPFPDASPNQKQAIVFIAAAVGAGTATTLTHPFEVIKTKQQLEMGQQWGLRQVARAVYAKDGLTGFFRALVPRLVRRSLMSGITWTLYSTILKT